jgi:cell division protein FtsB
MNVAASNRDPLRARLGQFGALGFLLLLGGLALAGPYGVLSWGESKTLLEKRQKQIAMLTAERDELQNRVALLDPAHVDPDLASELVRKDLNVAHPDEYVIELDQTR